LSRHVVLLRKREGAAADVVELDRGGDVEQALPPVGAVERGRRQIPAYGIVYRTWKCKTRVDVEAGAGVLRVDVLAG